MDASRLRTKWSDEGAGARYVHERWSSERARLRDPRMVEALLARHLPARGDALRGEALNGDTLIRDTLNRDALILDAPCGTGRLAAVLARRGRTVGVDVSLAMLAEADAREELLRGDVTRLPFRDSSFDAVVCCRLLHHLAEPEALARVLAELVRVSRALVIASFWDAGSLPAWRRAWFPSQRAPRRWARSRGEIARAFARAGAEVVDWRHSLRFVSRQAFAVARKCGTA